MTCPFGNNPLSSFFFDGVTFPSVSSTDLGAAACIAQSLLVSASTKEIDFILGGKLRGLTDPANNQVSIHSTSDNTPVYLFRSQSVLQPYRLTFSQLASLDDIFLAQLPG